jgi:uncharacterized protein YdhG (YjbR/CyaY superfamily)
LKADPVDDFVKRRVQPEHQAVVALVRKLMRVLAPDATEVISYGIPAWRRKRILAVLSPTRKDVTLAFSRGAEFEDRHDRLQGVGKVSKHLKLKDPKDVSKTLLQYYVRQALKHDDRD